MTNGDKVRQMTNSDLEELWSVVSFEDKYLPECSRTGEGCTNWDFTCSGCPKTFRSWLDAEVEE